MTIDFKRERVEYWVGKGAQMSATVSKLFAKAPAAPAEIPVA
jgi:ribosomal protein S16